MTTVFVNGTFDLLHRAHLEMLNYAKSFGNYLIVAIDTDARVKEKKGQTRPIYNQDDRAFFLKNLKSVDQVETFSSDQELENLCDLSVRGLEELIDYQEYPVVAAERATKARRSLGVGFIGLAHYLAKLGYKYDSQEAWDAVHGLSESFQYYLLKEMQKCK